MLYNNHSPIESYFRNKKNEPFHLNKLHKCILFLNIKNKSEKIFQEIVFPPIRSLEGNQLFGGNKIRSTLITNKLLFLRPVLLAR